MFDYPGIALHHLDRLTDSTGLIQHAIYNIPRRDSGYTTDDNARALRLCVRLWSQNGQERMLQRVATYLGFLEFARTLGGGFHNFLSYDRRWLDTEGCGDCQGQAVRALAEVFGSRLPDDYRALARELIESVLPALADLRSLRAQAYIVLAWGHLCSAGVKDLEPLEGVAWLAARRLGEAHERARRPSWPWFESRMTYANGVLPHAMFVAAQLWPREKFLEIAESSLAFLTQETTVHGLFWPVGTDGWYSHREEKSPYDQQPVEAVTMADAAWAAFQATGEEQYLATFRRAYRWFHGENSLHQPLADPVTGACRDGLHPNRVNRNQGAESTFAYLWTELQHQRLPLAQGDQAAAVSILA